jgi:translation initiation factor 2 subunit 1
MYLLKKNFPKEGEIVIATVKSIARNVVFLTLDEYNKDALLNIPEVAPGRIRNIRDYVREGKKVICVVLNVYESTSNILVSLRRVSESQRRKKNDDIKQELIVENILKVLCEKNNLVPETIFQEIYSKIEHDYETMFDFLQDIIDEETDVLEYFSKKDKNFKVVQELIDLAKERITPQKAVIKMNIKLKIYLNSGIEMIKEVFSKVLDLKNSDTERLDAKYLGGGNYEVVVVGPTYDKVNQVISKIIDVLTKHFSEKESIEFSYKVIKNN